MVQEKKMVEIKSVSFTDIKIPNPVFLINLLDEISMDVYGDIKRAKGFSQMLRDVINSIMQTLHSIREFEKKDRKLVFISPSVDKEKLEKLLNSSAIIDDDD